MDSIKCQHCGAEIDVERTPLRVMAANVVCGGLLLAVLIPAVYFVDHQVCRQIRRYFDHLSWREPLNDWNL